MKINATITVSRPSNGTSDHISVRLVDRTSGITFFEGEMDPDIFMRALTGLSYQDFRKAEVRGLQNVGKHRESKDVS